MRRSIFQTIGGYRSLALMEESIFQSVLNDRSATMCGENGPHLCAAGAGGGGGQTICYVGIAIYVLYRFSC
ncbi:MAG: hypothetical protein CM1200mP41_13270 [Gammaproteobacteria bacterium]|nr:MAG: hypothetical protein CM1200mP41_13270 [Gammaproteobacteria bacterium]